MQFRFICFMNVNNRIYIANCPVDVLSVRETNEKIERFIVEKQLIHHVVINAGKLVEMQKDQKLYDSVIKSDIINADGQSIIWASRFLSQPLPERVAGIDLMESLIEMAYQKGFSCYFFGAKEEVVQKVVHH